MAKKQQKSTVVESNQQGLPEKTYRVNIAIVNGSRTYRIGEVVRASQLELVESYVSRGIISEVINE